jgi:cullin 4
VESFALDAHHRRVSRREHEMRPFIKRLVSHLVLHGQYHPLFESFFIDVTQSFYVEESTECAASFKNQAHIFLTHVNMRVEEEVQRCRAVLPESSWSTVEMVTEKSLMDGRLEWLATEGEGVS